MSSRDEAVLRLGVQFAKEESRKAQTELKKLNTAYELLVNSGRGLTQQAAKTRAEIALQRETVVRASAAIVSAERDLTAYKVAQREAGKAARQAASDIELAARRRDSVRKKELSAAMRADEAYDDISRDVGIAGDVESNLLAFEGAARTFGIDGGALGIAAEFGAIAEAAPRLKVAIQGLPAQLAAGAAALGPFGVALLGLGAGLAAGVALVQSSTREIKEAVQAQIEANRELIRSIEVEQLTTEQAAQRREQAARELAAAERELAVLQLARASGVEEAERRYGAVAGSILSTIGNTYGDLDNAISENQKLIAQSQIEVNTWTGAIDRNVFATNDARAREEELTKAREEAAKAAQRLQDQLVQQGINLRASSLPSADASGAQERISAIDAELAAINIALADGLASPELVASLQERITLLQAERNAYAQILPDLIAHEDALADAAQAEQRYNDALARSAQARQSITALTESTTHQEIELERKFRDQQIAIVENAVAAAESAYSDLEQKSADLARDYARDISDMERKAQLDAATAARNAQRVERDALRNHLREIRQLRERAQADIERAEAEGDFAQVAELERSLNRELALENRDAVEAAQDREQARADEANERAIAYAEERQQRLQAAVRASQDAQAAYQQQLTELQNKQARELATLQQASTQELDLLRTTTQAKLSILQQAAQQEISITQQLAQNRIAAQAQSGVTRAGAVAQITAAYNATRRAGGGPLAAGQASWVNDGYAGQRESFNGQLLPNGLGLFIPAKSGSVTTNNSSVTVAPVFNITTGGNATQAQALVSMIDARLQQTLREIVAV